MRRHRLEIGDEWHVRARAHEVTQIHSCRDDGFLPQRTADADIALRPGDRRRTGEHLPPLAPNQVGENDIDPMLVGDVAREPLPASHARRTGGAIAAAGPGAACRWRGRHEEDLRAVERSDRRGEAVPYVLANEERRAAPWRIESAYLASALDEALLVEQTVRRQEDFAVYVPDDRLATTERHVHRRVVQGVAPHLVEADRDVERARRMHGTLIRHVEVAGERAGGDSLVTDTALEEVPGQRGLGQTEYRRARLQRVDLGEQSSQPRQVPAVIGLTRSELCDRQMDERGHRRKDNTRRARPAGASQPR